LPVIHDRALVVRAQEDEGAVELEQKSSVDAVDFAVRRLVVSDYPPQIAPRGQNLGHAGDCSEAPVTATTSRFYRARSGSGDLHRTALGFEDRVVDVAQVLAVDLERQRAVAHDLDAIGVVLVEHVPRRLLPLAANRIRREARQA